nr:lytic transglycosylase domain-containing protein [Thiosulfatihalobacter marinus]
MPVRADRASILAAIRATSDRHTGNRALTAVGLTSAEWHILFRAMIEAESAYDPNATSPKGAYGLGQLMPATARALGVDRNDPAQNLEGAARYLLAQLSTFRDIDLALAAYNAGPDRVREYDSVPPFAETRGYIARIHNIRSRLSGQPTLQPVIRVSTRNETRVPVVIDLN